MNRLLFALAVFLNGALLHGAHARTHVVQRGETLTAIAAKYGLDLATLARANKLRDQHALRRGQKLQIPVSTTVFVEHRVARGDALATIASRYRCSVADLRAHNALVDPDHIVIGQVLKVPIAPAARGTVQAPPPTSERSHAGPGRKVPAHVQAAIDRTAVRAGAWQNIVIHHSATREGSGKGMDRYHREERHMENGLAYHFVIGNGNGMGDGEIYVGARWTKQLPGGHLAIEALNEISLGVCLVGDFEKRAPTRRQLDNLEALVRALQKKTAPKSATVTSHRRIHPRHTKCPGRHFPMDAFLQRLQRP
jgi:LysM repeat protein